MRRVVVALAVCALSACGVFAPSGSGGGGSGGSGGGGTGGSGGGTMTAGDSHEQHNLDMLNMYRAQAGVAPLVFDAQLTGFSQEASTELEATGQPHGYFIAQSNSGDLWNEGFCGTAAENQAPGWPVMNGDEDATIDAILKAMMDEGPGGGHHDNILSAPSTRVGIGLLVDAQQQLWFTNDFSGPCQ